MRFQRTLRLLPATLILTTAFGGSGCTATQEPTSLAKSELVGAGPQTPSVMTYDALGRLQSVEYKSVTKRVTFDYDTNGNRVQRVVDANITNANPVVP